MGCTWRLVKGLTYDVLPCRSVECGSSSTAAATAFYDDKGTLFLSFAFFLSLLPPFFSSIRASPFSRVNAKSSNQKTRLRTTTAGTVFQRYRPVISNVNSRRVTYTSDSCILQVQFLR